MYEKKLYCNCCNKNTLHKLNKKFATYYICSLPIKIKREFYLCSKCYSETFDIENEITNLERATIEFNEKLNIISPEEFKLLRKKHNISIKKAAETLKIPIQMIQEFENNNIIISRHGFPINPQTLIK